ncbi:hypothetical protein HPP92_021681 [Vanilla planifolia]|uniref:ABC transmembrane type-1 domain-containing protein n=1 Tax=Vanilla planifolia TaxID=51239 RepID=A0A835Q1L8_VANPL|nr:hypothetical protein HPP92_021681 [Vanilla planifolia]
MGGAAMSFIILKLSASLHLAYAEAGSVVEETVGSIRTVASFSGEKQAIQIYGLAIWYVAKLIAKGEYSGGNVINIMLVVFAGAMSLSEACPSLSAFSAGQIAAHKMFEMIHRKPEIDAYEMSGVVLDDIKGDIKLKNVYFSYPARADQLPLEKLLHTSPALNAR